jgi:hypothetical protein
MRGRVVARAVVCLGIGVLLAAPVVGQLLALRTRAFRPSALRPSRLRSVRSSAFPLRWPVKVDGGSQIPVTPAGSFRRSVTRTRL